ncbi:MAG: hypothetical protein ACI9MR_004670 [Myxococcota bacterium]|jgi:hypothetical protein
MSTSKDARKRIRQVRNPPNPWHHTHVEPLGPPPEADVEIFEDATRSALSKNQGPESL